MLLRENLALNPPRKVSSSRLVVSQSGHLRFGSSPPGKSHPLDLHQNGPECESISCILTAETSQDTGGLVALLVQSRGPECFGAQLVTKLVYWWTQLVYQSIEPVESYATVN